MGENWPKVAEPSKWQRQSLDWGLPELQALILSPHQNPPQVLQSPQGSWSLCSGSEFDLGEHLKSYLAPTLLSLAMKRLANTGQLVAFLIETRARSTTERCLADGVCKLALKALPKYPSGLSPSSWADMFEGCHPLLDL